MFHFKILKFFLKFSVIFCLSILLSEVSSRLYFRYFHRGRPPKLTELFIFDSDLGYANKANFSAFWCGVEVKTNSAGFRNYELEANKSDDVFRIMVLGDSITFGWWVEESKTFSSLLEKKLNSQKGTKLKKISKIEVINTGVPGYSTQQERIFFEKKGFLYKPDLVILAHCVNDLYPTENPFGNLPFVLKKHNKNNVKIKSKPISPFWSLSPLLDKSIFFTGIQVRLKNYFRRKKMKKIFSVLKKKKSTSGQSVLTKTLKEWEKLRKSVTKMGIPFVVVSFPQPYDIINIKKQNSFFAPLDEMMKINKFSGINLANVFPKYKGNLFDLYYEKDVLAVHLSEKGHELTAETIFNYLIKNTLISG